MSGIQVPIYVEAEEVAKILAYEYADKLNYLPHEMSRSEIRAKIIEHYERTSESARAVYGDPTEPIDWAKEIVSRTLDDK
jgi:hypothetical protein